MPADGEYIFEWTYQKDGSRDQGDDCVYVDEVCILPAVGVLGDVDGDGTVTISDALMIMRNAMQLLEFTPAQAAAADMDGDGLITVEDALNECFLSHYTGQQSSENSVKLYTREKMPKI